MRRNPSAPDLPVECLILLDKLYELDLVSPEFLQALLLYNEEERLATFDRYMGWLTEQKTIDEQPTRFKLKQDWLAWASRFDKMIRSHVWTDALDAVHEILNSKFGVGSKFPDKICEVLWEDVLEGSSDDEFNFEEGHSVFFFNTNFFNTNEFTAQRLSRPALYLFWSFYEEAGHSIPSDLRVAGGVVISASHRGKPPYSPGWDDAVHLVPDHRRVVSYKDYQKIENAVGFMIETSDSGAVTYEAFTLLYDLQAARQRVNEAAEEFAEQMDQEEGPDDGPADDDLVTSDYEDFYHPGIRRLIVSARKRPWQRAVREWMTRDDFAPNVWFQGERGDFTLLDVNPLRIVDDLAELKRHAKGGYLFRAHREEDEAENVRFTCEPLKMISAKTKGTFVIVNPLDIVPRQGMRKIETLLLEEAALIAQVAETVEGLMPERSPSAIARNDD